MFVPGSKADQEGSGAYPYLSARSMASFGEWRTAAKLEGEPILVPGPGGSPLVDVPACIAGSLAPPRSCSRAVRAPYRLDWQL